MYTVSIYYHEVKTKDLDVKEKKIRQRKKINK